MCVYNKENLFFRDILRAFPLTLVPANMCCPLFVAYLRTKGLRILKICIIKIILKGYTFISSYPIYTIA